MGSILGQRKKPARRADRVPARKVVSAGPADVSDASGAAVAHGHGAVFLNDYRHFALATGKIQHPVHMRLVRLHVVVHMIRVRLTGIGGVWSAGFSIDDRRHTGLLGIDGFYGVWVPQNGPLSQESDCSA